MTIPATLMDGGESPLRALVVDDSAVAREVISAALSMDRGFEVTTAPNAAVAAERIKQQRPNVMVLDLEMPGMSGLVFLEQLMARDPLPVVVCSGIARPGAGVAMRALELGAVEVIAKPDIGIRALLATGGRTLSQVVRAAASAQVKRIKRFASQERARPQAPVRPALSPAWNGPVIVIGASTGGTEALRAILTSLPADAPPVVVVQHMPGAFTGAFARRLDSLCAIRVQEAQNGEPLRPGVALIAPGGRQLEILKRVPGYAVRIYDGPTVSGHRPSVDVLFHSAAAALGGRGIGALLTGMGADGADGLLAMRKRGAYTIAQNEDTSVVFGMPKEAIERGGAADVLPLDRIATALLQQRC
jgi:two-component system, chemotaxis family, protein-glutamate methylesterase/glutaminase